MKSEACKILYVITDLEIGGVPLHLQRLATAMKGRGCGVTVVSLKSLGPVGEAMISSGVEVTACGGRGRWDFRVIARLTDAMRRARPDIVHSLLFHANFAARRAARRVGFPPARILCEIQTVEVERRWHLWIDRWTHRGCRLTIGNSPSVIAHLAAKARIPPRRLRLVRGGIDPAPIRAAAAIDKGLLGGRLGGDTPIVLWVGRLDRVKGLDPLLRAFVEVAAKTRAHLVLVGGGPLKERLDEQVRQFNLLGRVHLMGPRRDVPSLLKACDVFAFPSRTEGLPNALLEAMAAGCPIVTTDVAGCRDLIAHQQTGLLVPYGDTQALATAILRLLEDRDLAGRLGRNAAESVERNWHINRMLDEYAALYDEVLAAGKRGPAEPP